MLAARYDGLAHLAGTPSVAHSWTSPLAAHDNTFSGTVAVIDLCAPLNIPRIIFASSAAVYGDLVSTPVSEAAAASPLSPYGLQKLASEQYITLFAKHLGISAVNLRMFNVFSPVRILPRLTLALSPSLLRPSRTASPSLLMAKARKQEILSM